MDERELENLIDAGLASYSARPDLNLEASLEAKIIAECQAAPMLVKQMAARRWAGLGSAIAAAGLLAVLLMHHEATRPAELPEVALHTPSAQKAASEPTVLQEPAVRERSARTKVRHKPATNTAQASGYEPSPMTEQEQMLARLANEHPQQLLEVAARNQHQGDPLLVEPLSMATLTIEPIHIDSLDKQQSE